MSHLSELDRLLNEPGAPDYNWREIREQIHVQWSSAKTTESRIVLLDIFKTTMDIAETLIAEESLDAFREARQKDYNLLIVQEALIGENVSVELLSKVTLREVASGRMSPDSNLCKIAEDGMVAPHLSIDELVKLSEETSKTQIRGGFFRRLFRKK